MFQCSLFQFLPCSAETDFDFDLCMIQKPPQRVFDKIGCALPYVPNPYPKCDPANVTRLRSTWNIYKELVINDQKSMCPRPCRFIEIFTGLPESNGDIENRNNSQGHLKIYLKSTTKVGLTKNKFVTGLDLKFSDQQDCVGLPISDSSGRGWWLLRTFAWDFLGQSGRNL